MRALVKILLILALLSWGAAGLRLDISRHEERAASLPSGIERLASEAVTWAKDSEIEE